MSVSPVAISALLDGLARQTINFDDVIRFIEDHYRYTPQPFVNGTIHNAAGENEGSAKIFGFAKLNQLSQLDTLALFAEHYRQVLAAPQGQDHQNIRSFMYWGWQAFLMEKNPLTPRPDVQVAG